MSEPRIFRIGYEKRYGYVLLAWSDSEAPDRWAGPCRRLLRSIPLYSSFVAVGGRLCPALFILRRQGGWTAGEATIWASGKGAPLGFLLYALWRARRHRTLCQSRYRAAVRELDAWLEKFEQRLARARTRKGGA